MVYRGGVVVQEFEQGPAGDLHDEVESRFLRQVAHGPEETERALAERGLRLISVPSMTKGAPPLPDHFERVQMPLNEDGQPREPYYR